MPKTAQQKNRLDETIEPLNGMILVRKDEDRATTKGGIMLPEGIEIPVLTGRVLAIAPDLKDANGCQCPNCFSRVKELDKVIVNPTSAINIDMEDKNLFMVPYTDIIGVFRRST